VNQPAANQPAENATILVEFGIPGEPASSFRLSVQLRAQHASQPPRLKPPGLRSGRDVLSLFWASSKNLGQLRVSARISKVQGLYYGTPSVQVMYSDGSMLSVAAESRMRSALGQSSVIRKALLRTDHWAIPDHLSMNTTHVTPLRFYVAGSFFIWPLVMETIRENMKSVEPGWEQVWKLPTFDKRHVDCRLVLWPTLPGDCWITPRGSMLRGPAVPTVTCWPVLVTHIYAISTDKRFVLMACVTGPAGVTF
jgi:hypothetical protein